MVWLTNQQISRWRRKRVLVGSFLCWLFVMFITPKVPLSSPSHHVFADKRNFLGVPNTLNVMTNFPFLIVGVLGFVLCIGGGFFTISLKGEIWGWVLFYAGVAGLAFGSAYYHLKSDDNRIIWDTLPILIAYSSLFSSFLVERAGERAGLCCLVSLLFIAFLSIAYAGVFNDLRLCMTFQLIPFVAIPVLTILLPPKYTHSKYWLWASGAYILSGIENLADSKIYNANRYLISGHSLGHLCSAAAPILLTIMLLYRSIRFHRLGDLKGHP
ncbi:PREDICTED: uncharacterized protein LOC104799163 isoform X1 [Tarenaya hassleriana]|uniref:uncharacterized protein LOC104799163 isoform X1 n=1 Tax=Tarenaya hassleriana TaxID=28532 RepID=UPI00053C4098|nr:PREDICTED: uncharacterized protein LOC104799163 isoform X1 [Tarenaya hassleriana]